MYKYEMDSTRTVGAAERTWDAEQIDGLTDGQTDGVKPIYPPTTSLCGGIMNKQFVKQSQYSKLKVVYKKPENPKPIYSMLLLLL